MRSAVSVFFLFIYLSCRSELHIFNREIILKSVILISSFIYPFNPPLSKLVFASITNKSAPTDPFFFTRTHLNFKAEVS